MNWYFKDAQVTEQAVIKVHSVATDNH